MIRHITYASQHMTISAERCRDSALKFGCNESIIYSKQNIDQQFYDDNKHIFETNVLDTYGNPRGGGYWLWKPYFILKAVQAANDGDYIVYTDAGIEFVADVNHLLNDMTTEIMLFANGWRHGDWCKMDVLKAMGSTEFVNEQQVQASCIIVSRSQRTIEFLKEWLYWATQPGFIDDSESNLPNEKTFREHRHDQAILTNLAYKYSILLNRWCAQYKLRGQEQFSNNYPVMFQHHRKRNKEYEKS